MSKIIPVKKGSSKQNHVVSRIVFIGHVEILETEPRLRAGLGFGDETATGPTLQKPGTCYM